MNKIMELQLWLLVLFLNYYLQKELQYKQYSDLTVGILVVVDTKKYC